MADELENVEISKEDNPTEPKKEKRPSKIFTGVSFGLVWFTILLAILFDFIAFKDVILHFIAGIIVTGIAFVVLTMFFVASFALIFGFILVKDYGFWPFNLTINLFKDIMGDIQVTAEAVQLFTTLRIIICVVCVAIIVLAIIAKFYIKKDKEMKLYRITDNTVALSTTALTMGIIGLLMSLSLIAIFTAL